MLAPIPLTGHSYKLASQLSAQRLVNIYPEPAPPDATRAKTGFWLRPTPGAIAWATVGQGPIRGAFPFKGKLFVVSGGEFYKVDSTGSAVLLGNVPLGTGLARFSASETELVVTVGSGGYYTDGNTFQAITDTDFPGAALSAFYLGRFVSIDPNTQRFRWSDQYDASSWQGLDFASAELESDQVKAIAVNGQVLWFFGEHGTETWGPGTSADIPFVRYSNNYLERGIDAPMSLHEANGVLHWLADDGRVYRIGQGIERISTLAMEQAIAGYSKTSDAIATSYVWNGEHFYYLTFPTAGVTWGFGTTVGEWHERESGIGTAAARWRYNTAFRAFGQWMVGDSLSGRIDVLSGVSEAGNLSNRTWTLPEINNNRQRFTCWEIQLDMEVGQGLNDDAPKVMHDWSKDGGKTWSKERQLSLGKQGQYEGRVRSLQLGQARTLVNRFRMTDEVEATVFGAYADVEGATS